MGTLPVPQPGQICRRENDEVFETSDDAVDVLVRIFVGRRDGSRVAHPEVDRIRRLAESLAGPGQLDSVVDQTFKFVGQIGILFVWGEKATK